MRLFGIDPSNTFELFLVDGVEADRTAVPLGVISRLQVMQDARKTVDLCERVLIDSQV